jgi:hypothetical protein
LPKLHAQADRKRVHACHDEAQSKARGHDATTILPGRGVVTDMALSGRAMTVHRPAIFYATGPNPKEQSRGAPSFTQERRFGRGGIENFRPRWCLVGFIVTLPWSGCVGSGEGEEEPPPLIWITTIRSFLSKTMVCVVAAGERDRIQVSPTGLYVREALFGYNLGLDWYGLWFNLCLKIILTHHKYFIHLISVWIG